MLRNDSSVIITGEGGGTGNIQLNQTYNVMTEVEGTVVAAPPPPPPPPAPEGKMSLLHLKGSKKKHADSKLADHGLTGQYSHPGSSKYMKEESYQKHFEEF